MDYVFALVLGACVGSFLNVVIYRLPRRLSVVRPGSHCPACCHPLSWRSKIPLLSYLWLRGRCRHCRSPIGWHYPAVEAVTALLFAAVVGAFGWTVEGLRYGLLLSLSVAAAEIDRRHGIIPNRLVAAGLVLGLLSLAGDPAGVVRHIAAAGGLFALLLLVRTGSRIGFRRAGMGMGDVKLGAVAAVFLGWEAFWAFYLALVLGAAVGLAGVWRGRLARSTPLPFAPFVAGGLVLDLFLLPAHLVLPL